MGFRRCLPVGIQLSMWKQLTLSCRRDEEAGREGAAPTAEAALCIRMRGEGGDYTRDLRICPCAPLLASTRTFRSPSPPPNSPVHRMHGSQGPTSGRDQVLTGHHTSTSDSFPTISLPHHGQTTGGDRGGPAKSTPPEGLLETGFELKSSAAASVLPSTACCLASQDSGGRVQQRNE